MAPTDKNPEVKKDVKKDLKDLKKPITAHVLVPPHRVLSDEERDELLNKYGIKVKQLPKISIKDPVIKSIGGVKPGDVVKIERGSTTAGKSVYYRMIKDE